MKTRKILTALVGILVALSGLALAISFLSNSSAKQSSTEIVFISSPANKRSEVKAGGAIAEKGSLQLGEFALLQLTAEDSTLELVSVDFNEKSKLIDSARARINSGSTLAVNLIFGAEITLLDDRVAATNQGGSFVFEKEINEKKDSTLIRALSGDTKLTFVDSTNSETFEGVLIEGEEVNLSDEAITDIFAAGDEIARIAKWRSNIGKFSSQFEGESQLINQALAKLPKNETNSILSFLKEKLVFSPQKREIFYTAQVVGTLAAAANGDSSSFEALLAEADLSPAIAGRAIPFTRLFVSKLLSPALKEKIARLAELATPLANFAETETLSPEEDLNRNLIFIFEDSDNKLQANKFLDHAESGINQANEASARLLLAILKANPQDINENWLSAWSAVNRARIIDNHDLANAITDQLELIDALIKDGRKTLAGSSLKELASLLARGSKVFDESSLEMIASAGNEMRNRVIFLASLLGENKFDEAEYKLWTEEQARLAIVNPPEEAEPEEELTGRADDANRVARPESELIKFLNITFPESDTQEAEEEMQEEEAEEEMQEEMQEEAEEETQEEEAEKEMQKGNEDNSILTLDILFQEEIYELNETIFAGEYETKGKYLTWEDTVNYTGDPFEGFVVLTYSETEGNAKGHISAIEAISDKTSSSAISKGIYIYDEADYLFTLEVYACEDIISFFKIDDCKSYRKITKPEEIIDELSPLASSSKTISFVKEENENTE